MNKTFLTTAEAADFLGFAKSYLYKLTMRNAIPFYKVGSRSVRFKVSDLEEYLSAHRVASNAELEADAEKKILNMK